MGEVVPLRGVFGCLLVGFTYLLNHLGCSLGGLVCFFIDPVWFLPGFGWLPLRVLKVCVKSFQCSDVSLHVDDARWTWVASLLYEVSTYACLFSQQRPTAEPRHRALLQSPAAASSRTWHSTRAQQPRPAEHSRTEQSTAAKQSRAEYSAAQQSTAEQSRAEYSSVQESREQRAESRKEQSRAGQHSN